MWEANFRLPLKFFGNGLRWSGNLGKGSMDIGKKVQFECQSRKAPLSRGHNWG